MKELQKTSNGTKGGLFVGKSHAKGGIPAIVLDTGQPIEVEGGEVIINKEASKKYWKELSKINQSAGNGVPIPPPIDFEKEVSSFKGGGKITMSAIRKGTDMEMEHQKTINSFKKSVFQLTNGTSFIFIIQRAEVRPLSIPNLLASASESPACLPSSEL